MVTITVRPLRDTFFTDRITMAAALASKPAKVNQQIRLEVCMGQVCMDQGSNLPRPIEDIHMNIQLHMQHARASCAQPALWAARYNTWLLIKLTPKGVVFSFLFFSFLFFSFLSFSFLFFSFLLCSACSAEKLACDPKPYDHMSS